MFLLGSVPYFWTSGRKCNFGGCDKPEFFPKLVNGWFWSANQVKMPPTNGNQFHDWSNNLCVKADLTINNVNLTAYYNFCAILVT